jgi:nicotine blue oxidoreductase
VLAAGAGRRYGMPKALVDGWLPHAIDVLRDGGCDPVRVVLGARAGEAVALLAEPELAVIAADWDRGMSASLRAGLAALRQPGAVDVQAALVHLVDVPDVTAAVVRRVVAHAGPAAVVRATYSGAPGHPVLLGRDHWAEVAGTAHGDRGARDWLAARPDLLTVECGDLAGGADRDAPAEPLA